MILHLKHTFSANQVSPELPEVSTEDVKNGTEIRNLYKSIGDPPRGIKSVTDGVLVSPFLLAVLGAGGLPHAIDILLLELACKFVCH